MVRSKKSTREDLEEIYKEMPSEPEPDASANSASGFEETEAEPEIYFNPEAGKAADSPANRLSSTRGSQTKRSRSNSGQADEAEPALVSDMQKSNSFRIKKGNSFFKKLILFLLVCGLIAVSYLIWQAYNNITNPEVAAAKKVSLKITGPQEIISGQLTEYQIVLENNSEQTLIKVEVTLRFPSNFIASEFQPLPENSSSQEEGSQSGQIAASKMRYFWQYSSLPPHAKKEIIVFGQTFGEIGSQQLITASGVYQPENFSSEFKTSSILKSEISDTIISLRIEAPTEIIDNTEIEYLIKIKPSLTAATSSPLENLKVFVEYPPGFTLSNIETKAEKLLADDLPTAPKETEAVWLIRTLEPEQIIKITGLLTGEAGEYKELLVKVGYYVGDEFKLQAGESFITLVIKPKLELTLEINNLKLDSFAADWSDEISYNLTYANQGEIKLSDVILKLNFSGDNIIDWQSISCERTEDCGFLLGASDNDAARTLIWTRDQLPDLAHLDPSESGIIKLKANIKAKDPNENRENYHTVSQAKADFKVEKLDEPVITKSNEIIIKIKTQAELETEARYYTDEYLKIGSGPLPPLVGAATSFRIFWQINNSSNALKNPKVVTTLPNNVTWTNKIQTFVGVLEYNAYNRQVIWTVPELGAYSDNNARANFEISITPTLDQIGGYLTLTRETSLEAIDSFTNEPVSALAGYLTSELENDLGAQGKGRVE